MLHDTVCDPGFYAISNRPMIGDCMKPRITDSTM